METDSRKKKRRDKADKKERKISSEALQMEKKHVKEIRLLEQGYQPEKNKIGSEFKGKNRVIIA